MKAITKKSPKRTPEPTTTEPEVSPAHRWSPLAAEIASIYKGQRGTYPHDVLESAADDLFIIVSAIEGNPARHMVVSDAAIRQLLEISSVLAATSRALKTEECCASCWSTRVSKLATELGPPPGKVA